MAQPAQPAKVLRIGIIRDGKIEQERLMKSGETVSIGPAPKATFVQQVSVPTPEFVLFEYRAGKYFLHFTSSMKGKVGSNAGSVTSIEKLLSDPSVERSGDEYVWALTEDDRGKVSIENVTVLFQFVSPPPPPVRTKQVDFRPRLVADDDKLFPFLLFFGALGAVFLTWVAFTDMPVEEPLSIQQLDPKWTKLLINKPEPPPPAPSKDEADQGKDAKPEKLEETPDAAEKVAEASEAQPKPQVSEAERKAKAKEGALAKSKALGFLVTRGDSQGGTAVDRFADSGFSKVSGALKDVTAVTEGAGGGTGVRGTGDQKGEDVKIGQVGVIGGGNTKVEAAAAIKVDVEVGTGEVDDPSSTDANLVKNTVGRNSGQLKYCYEQRLKANPSLTGRVEIEWMMNGGRVTSASVFANTTGDDEFAQCIVTKIKRWSFDPSLEGEVTWPFIFKSQKQ